jgi:ABC-type polar amino acid transport system ATPase subunit
MTQYAPSSSSLDPPTRGRLVATLRSLSSAQLIATHDLAFAKSACTRILLLEDGRISLDTPAGTFPDDPWDER